MTEEYALSKRPEWTRLILGCGTGRCGTKSLQHLLNLQGRYCFNHETLGLPWEADIPAFKEYLSLVTKSPSQFEGEVAFYLLPYVRHAILRYSNVRVICLRRERQACIDSWVRWCATRDLGNPWNLKERKDRADWWGWSFPDYPGKSIEQAAAAYYDDYYMASQILAAAYPWRFKLVEMERVLNFEEDQRELLQWLGFLEPVLQPGITYNANPI